MKPIRLLTSKSKIRLHQKGPRGSWSAVSVFLTSIADARRAQMAYHMKTPVMVVLHSSQRTDIMLSVAMVTEVPPNRLMLTGYKFVGTKPLSEKLLIRIEPSLKKRIMP